MVHPLTSCMAAWAVALLFAGCHPLWPQILRGPDPLIIASSQAAHADTLWNRCEYAQAQSWLHQALETVRTFRSAEPAERDTAGALVARLEIRLADWTKQRKELDKEFAAISQLVVSGWLATASKRIQEVDPPHCDTRFEQFKQQIHSRQAEARSLMEWGDEYLNERDAKTALALYERAQRLDREQPELESRFAEAKSLKRSQRRIGAKIGKVLLYTAIVGSIGYAGYLGYETYQERKQPQARVRLARALLRSSR